jgi:sugar/nucleoside kinase (ribokinase family)
MTETSDDCMRKPPLGPAERELDLLVLGEINPDLLLRGDVVPRFGQIEQTVRDAALVAGSSAVITACGASRLGLSVGFIGLCGDDVFGRFMREHMIAAGIDVRPVCVEANMQTGFTIHLTREDGDRALLTFPGAIAAFGEAHIDTRWFSRARHLHIASFFLQESLRPSLPGLAQMARDCGMTVSLDTNWDPVGQWNGNLRQTLAWIDIFLPNANEAQAIAGADDLGIALDRLAESIPIVAVKCGDQGGVLRSHSFQVRCRPPEVIPLDTTGAGDTFNAGFLAGYLKGCELDAALRIAVTAGSLSTQALGGTAGQPDWTEVSQKMKAVQAEVMAR